MVENDSHLRRAKTVMDQLLKYHADRTASGFIPRFILSGDDILIAAEFMGYGIEDLQRSTSQVHKDSQPEGKEWTGPTLGRLRTAL